MSSSLTLGEFPVPEGVTPEELNWLLLSWDIRKEGPSFDMCFHFLLAPTALHLHFGDVKKKAFLDHSVDDRPGHVLDKKGEGSYDLAVKETKEKLDLGYKWECRPFVLDMNELQVFIDGPTLRQTCEDAGLSNSGEALLSENRRIRNDLVISVLAERIGALKDQKKRAKKS